MKLVRDRYTSTNLADIKMMQRKLVELSEDEQYTNYTRRLAASEADYLEDVVEFRLLPPRTKKKLYFENRTPWQGTWTRKENADEPLV